MTEVVHAPARGYFIAAVLLVPLAWFGNPAVALLTGIALTLVLDRPVLADGKRYGKLLLQTAVVLLGFRLSIGEVVEVSAGSIWLVVAYVLGMLLLGALVARVMRLERESATLLAGGTAICGGTAIATLAPIVGARSDQLGVAVAIVFLLNAVALFTFPTIGAWLELDQRQFGIWAALAIHDTSSVVATAAVYGEEALEVATTVKLGRTLWLIPLALGVSLWLAQEQAKVRVPGFVLAFLAAAVIASFVPIPEVATNIAATVSRILLVAALFFVGTEITRETLKKMRGGVVAYALVLWGLGLSLTLAAVLYTDLGG